MTADQAAERLYETLRKNELAVACGSHRMTLQPSAETGGAPTLTWEEGPYEWAVCLTGGDSLVASELGDYSRSIEPRLAAAINEVREEGFYFEPVNSFTLAAYRV